MDLFGSVQPPWKDRYAGRKNAHPGTPGRGPGGETCKTCGNRLALEYHNRIYHKCNKVKVTHGLGTDLRLKDEACEFWEKRD